MFCSYKFLLFFLLTTLSSRPTLEADDEFNYIIGSDKGPARWGDLEPEWAKCKTGLMQSPVNISHSSVVQVSSIGHLTRNYSPANATLTSDHDVRIEWQGDAGFIELDCTASYTLNNVHWHAPSEHTIDGIRYDLELHMVHINSNPNVINNITVIAHLYRFGLPDPFISTIISRLDKTNQSINIGVTNPNTITCNGLDYYIYTGSLTTPPCSENVTWIINSTIKHASREQVQIIRNAFGDKGEGNARPLQPINNRTILFGPFSY